MSQSSTESEVISLDAGLRVDGILDLDLWRVVIGVLHLQCGTKSLRTISGFLELISRLEFDVQRRGFFLDDSNFWCVQSSITHNVYMCLCCGLFVPTQFHFECCGVLDDSR